MRKNIILSSDSYKYSHHLQIPEKTETIYSYIEARGSNDEDYKETVFFGIQAYIKEYLLNPITMDDILEAKEIIESHGEPFNYDGWVYILEKHNGYIPVEIEAVPEGSIIPLQNVLVQIHNTDTKVPWITAFIETALLRAIWYGTTVATNSWTIKQFLKDYTEKSGSIEPVDFKLHDFGARGVSSSESAMLGGMAHLVNFMGTDTVEALVGARRYYNEPMAGFSIPASEHSTITIWGKENESKAYKNMLDKFAKPNSLVAVVSDSYDIYNAIKIWGIELKDGVVSSGATVVVRPDSGDPTIVPIEVIEGLMEYYGYEVNEFGYKTLPKCIRVIQGDGINKDSIKQILKNLDEHKLTLDNIAFGMGGALLQGVNRDTLKFAMKTCYAIIDGVGRYVSKEPVGDKSKRSKDGILDLIKYENLISKDTGHSIYKTVKREDTHERGVLKPVYRNGVLLEEVDFSTIRELANQ
jgi:nicotinamide phosphoribosyltransferase